MNSTSPENAWLVMVSPLKSDQVHQLKHQGWNPLREAMRSRRGGGTDAARPQGSEPSRPVFFKVSEVP